MARVKIDLPGRWLFRAEIPVRITDLNYGRHVGNDTMLALLQEARVQWLNAMGYPSELLEDPVGLILVDLAVRFKTELGYGERLCVQLAVTEWTRAGFEVTYLATRARDGAEVARAVTGFVFFDYSTRRLASPPASFRERVEALASRVTDTAGSSTDAAGA